MWAPRVDPINQASALEGIRVLRQGLADVARRPQDIEAREQTLYGAYLAASAFTSADPGLHHKICHVLGGLDNLPHAQTHALVLPHVLAFDAPSFPTVTNVSQLRSTRLHPCYRSSERSEDVGKPA